MNLITSKTNGLLVYDSHKDADDGSTANADDRDHDNGDDQERPHNVTEGYEGHGLARRLHVRRVCVSVFFAG